MVVFDEEKGTEMNTQFYKVGFAIDFAISDVCDGARNGAKRLKRNASALKNTFCSIPNTYKTFKSESTDPKTTALNVTIPVS